MTYSQRQVHAARRADVDPWSIGNDTLYRLCREHPGHTDLGEVVAKLWLIGRSYSAPLDRGRSRAGGEFAQSDDFYVKTAAPRLIASGIDNYLAKLPSDVELTAAMLPSVLQAHGTLTEIFKKVAGKRHRSLASKYLHFHRPHLFFILDSRACAALKKVQGAPPAKRRTRGADSDYAEFVYRVFAYREALVGRFGVRITPRELDRLLIGRLDEVQR